MTQCFVSFAIAAALTSVFAFRFQTWRRPGLLAGYFVVFFVAEFLCEHFWLPPNALGIEVGIVCLVLAVLFAAVSWIVHRTAALDQIHES